MRVCRVVGNVVSTTKCERLKGAKLLVVREIEVTSGEYKGEPQVAVDTVGAGEGEEVLIVAGSSSRRTVFTHEKPVDLAIIAIIDSIEVGGELIFKKHGEQMK